MWVMDGSEPNPWDRVMWTMPVELYGSVMIIFIVLMVSGVKRKQRTIILGIAYLFCENHAAHGLSNHLSSFIAGALIAHWVAQGQQKQQQKAAASVRGSISTTGGRKDAIWPFDSVLLRAEGGEEQRQNQKKEDSDEDQERQKTDEESLAWENKVGRLGRAVSSSWLTFLPTRLLTSRRDTTVNILRVFLGVFALYLLAAPDNMQNSHYAWLIPIAETFALRPADLFRRSGSILLIFIVAVSPRAQKQLSKKVPVFLGRISFALYLVHFLVLFSVGTSITLSLSQDRDLNYQAASLVASVITLILSLLAAWIVTIFIDEPGVRLCRKLERRWALLS